MSIPIKKCLAECIGATRRTDRLRLARQFAFVEFRLRGSPKESAVRQPTQNLVNWGVTQGRYGFPDKCCP